MKNVKLTAQNNVINNDPKKMSYKLDLSDKLLGQFEMFPNFHRPVNNPDNRIFWLKFSPDGEHLIAASNKRNIGLYDCNTGLRSNSFTLTKHGMSCIDYMDSNDVVLVGSNAVKNDYAVRELNFTKNCYGTCYTGHSLPAIRIDVNREKKYFITSGYDKCAMLFDFRVQAAQLSCSNLPCPPLVALHPTSSICAMAFDNYRIEIYDLRSMNLGPFSIFKLNTEHVKWTSLKYSPDGQQLLISSNGSTIRIINSFTGVIQEVFGCKLNFIH